MRSVLGFRPSYTTAEAFADFGRSLRRVCCAQPETAAVLAPVTLGGAHG